MIIFFAAVAAYICGKGYIFLWHRKIDLTTTPIGFGILLPVFVLTFMALIPQLVNIGAILFLADWIQSTSVPRFWALFLSSVAFTPLCYLACRMLLVERNYFFGDGEPNR